MMPEEEIEELTIEELRELYFKTAVAFEDYRSQVEEQKGSSLEKLYRALDKQLNQFADDLDNNYVSFASKTDKTFERFWKAMVDSKEVAQNLIWLKKELNIDEDKSGKATARSGKSPIEEYATQNYKKRA